MGRRSVTEIVHIRRGVVKYYSYELPIRTPKDDNLSNQHITSRVHNIIASFEHDTMTRVFAKTQKMYRMSRAISLYVWSAQQRHLTKWRTPPLHSSMM